MPLNTLLSQLLFTPDSTSRNNNQHVTARGIILLSGNLMCFLDEKFNVGMVLQKKAVTGRLKIQQGSAT